MTSSAYSITGPGSVCAATGEPLKPGEPYIGALFESGESEGYERRDYSVGAWEGGARPGHVFAHWRGVVAALGAKPKMLIDDESLVGMFDDLGSAEDPKRAAFRFVLALLLIRRRVLVDAGRGVDPAGGGPALLVRRKSDGPDGAAEVVRDPGLDEAMLADVMEQVNSLLKAAS